MYTNSQSDACNAAGSFCTTSDMEAGGQATSLFVLDDWGCSVDPNVSAETLVAQSQTGLLPLAVSPMSPVCSESDDAVSSFASLPSCELSQDPGNFSTADTSTLIDTDINSISAGDAEALFDAYGFKATQPGPQTTSSSSDVDLLSVNPVAASGVSLPNLALPRQDSMRPCSSQAQSPFALPKVATHLSNDCSIDIHPTRDTNEAHLGEPLILSPVTPGPPDNDILTAVTRLASSHVVPHPLSSLPTHVPPTLSPRMLAAVSSQPQTSNRSKRPAKEVLPSRFCHVCGRRRGGANAAGGGRAAMCGRVSSGLCRKVVCAVCLERLVCNPESRPSEGVVKSEAPGGAREVESKQETSGDEKKNTKEDIGESATTLANRILESNGAHRPASQVNPDWLCPHCTDSCGERAQCATYRRTNFKRHVLLRERKRRAAASMGALGSAQRCPPGVEESELGRNVRPRTAPPNQSCPPHFGDAGNRIHRVTTPRLQIPSNAFATSL